MEKPKKKPNHDNSYNYLEVGDYLGAKYGYDERDYDGKHKAHDRTGQLLADRLGVNWKVWRKTPFAKMEGPDAVLRDALKQLDATCPRQHQDFWVWVLKNYDISNGCFVTFTRDKLDEIAEEWVYEIYARYIGEFADPDGTLLMWVWW